LFVANGVGGLLAGFLLGYLGVFVVLRRSVFVTATVSQAAGLGVALAFFLQIHAALPVPPVFGAIVVALGFTAVLALPLERLPMSRESLIGVPSPRKPPSSVTIFRCAV